MVRQRGLRGGTYGPASKGKTFTPAEVAAYAQEHGGTGAPRPVKRAVRRIVEDEKYKEPSLAVLMGERLSDLNFPENTENHVEAQTGLCVAARPGT